MKSWGAMCYRQAHLEDPLEVEECCPGKGQRNHVTFARMGRSTATGLLGGNELGGGGGVFIYKYDLNSAWGNMLTHHVKGK